MVSRLSLAGVWLLLSGVLVLGGVGVLADASANADADDTGYDRADRINETAVEAAVVERLNELRRAEGVAALPTQPRVSTQATAWSDRMVNGSYEHSPRGYYQCRAAENIATLPAYGDVELRNGEVANYYGNETAIADGLVDVWNRSPPHRANMLDPSHSAVGVGITAVEENGTVEVYATQAFCTG